MTDAITSSHFSRTRLLRPAAGGILTGVLTPLLPPLIDKISHLPADLRIGLAAIPFALLVAVLVRRSGPNPWWTRGAAAVVTMIAFVAAGEVAHDEAERPGLRQGGDVFGTHAQPVHTGVDMQRGLHRVGAVEP